MGDSHKDSNQAASCKELRATVAEIIRENFLDVEKECIKLDRYRTGKILKSEVRKVLAGYCNLLSMDQLNCLIQPALVDACNKVNYHQFLQEITGWTDNSERLPLSCTVDELESMLKYKIESNVANVLRGFYNYDCYKDGMIRKSDARRVLEHCCFKMTNSQFDSLWERYDPLHNNTLNYEDFLTRLGVKFHRSLNRLLPRDTVARNLCWRVPSSEDCHAKMKMQQLRRSAAAENITDPLVKGLSLDDTYRVFIRKLQTPGLDVMLTNGCLMFDSNNTGFILCEDFHAVLNHLVMPMSETLFLRLMERCMAPSTSARSLPWRTFIRRFCLSGTPLNQDPACQPYFDIG